MSLHLAIFCYFRQNGSSRRLHHFRWGLSTLSCLMLLRSAIFVVKIVFFIVIVIFIGVFGPPHAVALNNFFVIFVEIVIFVSSVDHLLLLVIFAILVIVCNPGDFSMIYGSTVPGNRTKGLIAQLGGGENFWTIPLNCMVLLTSVLWQRWIYLFSLFYQEILLSGAPLNVFHTDVWHIRCICYCFWCAIQFLFRHCENTLLIVLY